MNSTMKKQKLIALALALCAVITCIFLIIEIPAGAQEAEGMAFATDDMYQMSASISDRDYYTFETEIYVPSNLGNKTRAYNI